MSAPLATASVILTAPTATGAAVELRDSAIWVRLRDASGVTWQSAELLALPRSGFWALELWAAGTDGAQRTMRAVHASGTALVEVPAVRVQGE